jgi:hypothetical protein
MVTVFRLGFLAGLCAAAVLVAPAAASGPTIVATPNPVLHGHTVRIHGVVPGCRSNQLTLISKAFSHATDFAGLPAIYATIGAHSAYSVTARIPANKRGGYAITGRCGGGNIGVVRTLRVR